MESSRKRQGLCRWLEAKINSETIAGLEWIDAVEQIFKVPWKHGGKQDWNGERDSLIFREWALHTGKYREGIEEPDWSTWKTRFRCALNKSPEIQWIKDLSKLDSHDHPYRAYRFVKLKPNGRESDTKSEVSSTSTAWDSSPSSDYQDDINERGSNDDIPHLPEMEKSTSESGPKSMGSLPSDLKSVDTMDMLQSDAINALCNGEGIQTLAIGELADDSMEVGGGTESASNFQDQTQIQQELFMKQRLEASFNRNTGNDMKVSIRYMSQYYIQNKDVQNGGFRIMSPSSIIENIDQNLAIREDLVGPNNVEEYKLVPPENDPTVTPEQLAEIKNLLEHLDRGVTFQCENGDIYATRKCRTSVFVSSPSYTTEEPVKLVRNMRTKVFDYASYFCPTLIQYCDSQRRTNKPCSEILVGFGQNWKPNVINPTKTLLISATIVSCEAEKHLKIVSSTDPCDTSLQLSEPDSFDKQMEMVKHFAAVSQSYQPAPPVVPTTSICTYDDNPMLHMNQMT